jgi:hypothetical protein
MKVNRYSIFDEFHALTERRIYGREWVALLHEVTPFLLP